MKTVFVFRTSVTNNQSVNKLKPLLDNLMHTGEKWNFDLEDCDHILRVEAISLQASEIVDNLAHAGFACAELED